MEATDPCDASAGNTRKAFRTPVGSAKVRPRFHSSDGLYSPIIHCEATSSQAL